MIITVLTLVIYDIRDDSRRLKLSKMLQRYGLVRVQYSAFKGDLNPHDRHVLVKKLSKYVKDEIDCIFIIPLCQRCLTISEVVSTEGRSLISSSKVTFA